MKYIPASKKIIVQYLPPEEKQGIIITMKKEDDQTFKRGLVIETGHECPEWIEKSDCIYYAKYAGICIDKENNLFVIDLNDIYCVANHE